MPVPGSLKRQPVNKSEIAQLLERQFNLPPLETLAYLQMLERDSVGVDELAETLALSKEKTSDLLQVMIRRGLIIRAPRSKDVQRTSSKDDNDQHLQDLRERPCSISQGP